MANPMLLGRDRTQKGMFMLYDMLEKFKSKVFNPNHPLQRRSGRWPKEYKSSLATTVLKNEDIDPIKLCEQIFDDHYELWLIDGLQRFTVLQEFRNNKFSILPSQELPITYYVDEKTGEYVEYDLRKKCYSQLPKELQKKFDGYNIEVVKHLDCTNKEIAYHMKRYNNNCQMNANEKNFTYMLNMAESIKKLSTEHRFFIDCGAYTPQEKTKGILERVIMESMMLLFHFDCWTKGKKMNIYLDENASDAEIGIFEDELNRLTEIVDKETTGQLFNSKNSFIWFGAFHKFTEYGVEDSRFADFLVAFQNGLHDKCFTEYEDKSFDTYDDGKGTKDKKVVAAKLDMLEKLMRNFFNANDLEDEEIIEPEVETIKEVMEETAQENAEVEDNKENDVHAEAVVKNEEVTVTEVPVIENEHSVPTADEIEDKHTLDFVQETVDPAVDMEDIAMYKSFLDDYVRDNSYVKPVGNTVLIALLTYAYNLDKDNEFSEWIDKIGRKECKYSPNDSTNFKFLKSDFDKYLEGLDGKNAA